MSFDTSSLRNGKYYVGKIDEGFEKTRGWFIGSFLPEESPLKTGRLEVLYKSHKVGDSTDLHLHEKKVEIIFILEGKAKYKINDTEVNLEDGDFFFADMNNSIEGVFEEESKIIAIHAPSLPGDKVEIDNIDEVQLNKKYFVGNLNDDISETRDWILGIFLNKDNPLYTEKIEVKYIEREMGKKIKPHYHEDKVEVFILLDGKAKCSINEKEFILNENGFFFVDQKNVIEVEYLNDSKILAIHSPSITDDKIILS